MPSENAQSVQVLDELFQKLTVSKDAAEIKGASAELAGFINGRIGDQAVPIKYV
jgi:elongation factor 3